MTARNLMPGERGGHGLTAREQQIMGLYDAGANASQIAELIGRTTRSVNLVIGEYHFGKLGKEMSRAEAQQRKADLAYQQALIASGGTFA